MNTTPKTWAVEIDAWAVALRAARCSTETINLRTYHLRRLAGAHADRDPWSLTRNDLIAWMGSHSEWRRETARSYRTSIRRFWSWAVVTERTDDNPALSLDVIRPELPDPRPAPRSAVMDAMHEADRRTLVMVRLANELGMRRGEVAQVHSSDMVEDLCGWSLRVHGKGGRIRTLALPDDLARLLRRLPPGWAFPGGDHGHLSARWVGKLVGRTLPDGVTMHQLRHRFATDLNDDTKDLRLVQEALGHASLATTQRYVRVDQEALRDAIRARSARWSAA